jgi:hypothetical protein
VIPLREDFSGLLALCELLAFKTSSTSTTDVDGNFKGDVSTVPDRSNGDVGNSLGKFSWAVEGRETCGGDELRGLLADNIGFPVEVLLGFEKRGFLVGGGGDGRISSSLH